MSRRRHASRLKGTVHTKVRNTRKVSIPGQKHQQTHLFHMSVRKRAHAKHWEMRETTLVNQIP